jgi:hypothetical protein
VSQVPFDEMKCAHCKGLISSRMPVPSSGCDREHEYKDWCDGCVAYDKSLAKYAELTKGEKEGENG